MNKVVKVKAVWEFEVDVEDLNENFIDVKSLAKDLTKREMDNLLRSCDITADDFEYVID